MAAAQTAQNLVLVRRNTPAKAQPQTSVVAKIASGSAGAAIAVFLAAILIRFGVPPLWASLLVGGGGAVTSYAGRKNPYLMSGGIGMSAAAAANLAALAYQKFAGPVAPAAPAPRQAQLDPAEAQRLAAQVRDDYWRAYAAQMQQQAWAQAPRA